MSKPTRGSAPHAAGKKKAKRRPEQRPANPASSTAALVSEPAAEDAGSGGERTVVQFRPRGREAAVRGASGRATAQARALQQVVDYSYVYTDLKLIGVLAGALFGGLIILSFVLR